jgi:DNA (cytosine-5)-methyltransferase 1
MGTVGGHNYNREQGAVAMGMTKMGRPPQPGTLLHVVGHFSGVQAGRDALGAQWMTRDELSQAIPPAYTEYIGKQLIAHLATARVA